MIWQHTSEDPNDTAPAISSAIPGIPNESETDDITDITTQALDRAKIDAARARDELAAIYQGNRAVMKRVLERAEAEGFVRHSAVEIVYRVAMLTPGAPLPDDLYNAAVELKTFLSTQR